MEGGFTFDGVDIADLGLFYAPDAQNTYVWNPAQWKNHDETFEGHDGGYFYGSTVSPKDLTLRCIFENSDVREGVMTKIFNLFRRNRSGRLVFQRRPWIWYMATVVSCDLTSLTNKLNGIVTIKMRIYYPFGRSDITYIADDDPNKNNLISNSGMLVGTEWSTIHDCTESGPITSQTEVILFNPGTANAPVLIELAGDVGDGVTIANATTGTIAKFVGLTKAISTSAGKYLVLDSMNGKVVLTNGLSSTLGFFYHDNGVLMIGDGFPAIRDIPVTGSLNSHTVISDGLFTEDMKGRYLAYHASGELKLTEIISVVSENEITVANALVDDVDESASVVKGNKIVITPVGESMELTKLVFKYTPTFL